MLPDDKNPPAARRSPSLNAGKTERQHLFTQMPTELQTMIICSFRPKRRDHRRALCALACVNRALNALAVPQLYSRVTPRAFSAVLQRPTLAGLVKEIYNPRIESQIKSMRADLMAIGHLPENSTLDSDEEELERAQSREGQPDEEHGNISKGKRTTQLIQCLPTLTSLCVLDFPIDGANKIFFSALPNPIMENSRAIQSPSTVLRNLTHLDTGGPRITTVPLSVDTICGLFFLPSLTHLTLGKVIGPGPELNGGGAWTPIYTTRMENAYGTSAITHLRLDEWCIKPWMLTSLLRLPQALRSLHYVHEASHPRARDDSNYLDLGELERALDHHRTTLEDLDIGDVAVDRAMLRGRLTRLSNFSALTRLAIETNYLLSRDAPGVSLVSLLPAALKDLEIGVNGCPNVDYVQESMKTQLLEVIRKLKLKKLLLMAEGLDDICDEVDQVCEEMGTECNMESWD